MVSDIALHGIVRYVLHRAQAAWHSKRPCFSGRLCTQEVVAENCIYCTSQADVSACLCRRYSCNAGIAQVTVQHTQHSDEALHLNLTSPDFRHSALFANKDMAASANHVDSLAALYGMRLWPQCNARLHEITAVCVVAKCSCLEHVHQGHS